MPDTSLPRRETPSPDVIDLRPWDEASPAATGATLDAVLQWLDEPAPMRTS